MVLDVQSLRLGFAFGLGTATFFAPCAFPLLPGYVAFYLGDDAGDDTATSAAGKSASSTSDDDGSATSADDNATSADDNASATSADNEPTHKVASLFARLRRAVVVGLLTSLGFFLVYAALTGVVLALGTRVLGDIAVLELVVGVLLVGFGTAMAAGRFSPARLHVRLPRRRRTPTGFVVFGVVYAAAAAGCTAPFFIAIAATALSGGPVAAVATLGAYAAGMSVLMVGVTVLSALGRETVVRRVSARVDMISRLAGVVLVGAGLVQLYVYVVWYDGLAVLGL